jgi:hypothetical protein
MFRVRINHANRSKLICPVNLKSSRLYSIHTIKNDKIKYPEIYYDDIELPEDFANKPIIFRNKEGKRIYVSVHDYKQWKNLCKDLRGTDFNLDLEDYIKSRKLHH